MKKNIIEMKKESIYEAPEAEVLTAAVEKGVYSSGLPAPGDDSGFEWG